MTELAVPPPIRLRSSSDTDNDGITNDMDLDDDNDGILDADEGDGATDTDSDGTPDSLDLTPMMMVALIPSKEMVPTPIPTLTVMEALLEPQTKMVLLQPHKGVGSSNDVTTTQCFLTPFTCDDTVYQAISGELRSLDLSNGTYGADLIQPINNNPDPFSDINALGYNTTDDFIYGIVQGSGDEIDQGHLIRIDALGDVEDLGLVRSAISGDIHNDTLFFGYMTDKISYVENLSSLVADPSATSILSNRHRSFWLSYNPLRSQYSFH